MAIVIWGVEKYNDTYKRCPQTQATKLYAQWARQMATVALTIPRGEWMLSGTVWDHMLPH